MSLSVLNDGRDLDEGYANMMQAAWGPARVFAKVATEEPAKVDELYTILGNKVHGEEQGGKKGFGAYDELRSEEHTSELQSRGHLVCRLLLEKKKYQNRVPE